MAYKKEDKEKIFNIICKRISKGEALRNIINKKDTFSDTVFFGLIDSDKEKNKQYARACNERADTIFEDMINISDDQERDVLTLPNGTKVTNHNVINRSRLRIDTRKWILSKMNPKKYGDKVALEHESPDGSMSPKPNIIVNSEKTAKEIDKLIDKK